MQGSANFVSCYLGLQGFHWDGFEIREKDFGRRRDGKIKVITIQDARGYHVCSTCGKRHAAGVWQESEPLLFRDCSIGDFETYLEVYPWRVECCGKVARERFPFEQDGHRMTVRFFERIAALCTRLKVLEVAKMAKLSWDTVGRIDKEAIRLALGSDHPDLEGVRHLGFDEVSRTGGRNFFTIVTDLESGRVVYIGDKKGGEGLQAFIDCLDKRARRRIQLTASDLGYMEMLKKAFPKAAHVLDRFHIVKWVNDALKDVRAKEFGAGPKDEDGRVLKAKKWMYLKAREKLEQGQKLLLARLMKLNQNLYRGYLLKEQLRSILHHPWRYLGALRRNLNDWCDAAVRSRLEEFGKVGRRLKKHVDSVIAAYTVKFKMGLVEAVNGKIVELRRAARGYRDREYFKLKIFQRCSLPNNPWAEIIL